MTSVNKDLYNRIIAFLLKTPGVRAKVIAKDIGVTRKEVNQVLFSNEHKAEFIENENYEWFITPGITNPIEPINDIYFLTAIDHLPEITVYKSPVDFAEKLQYVNAAMLCMKCTEYVYVELKRHMETGDFYCDIINWQAFQKEWDGFVCNVACYDQEEGVRKRNFTDHLSDYSKLRLLGYHVGDNLLNSIRRRVLMHCLYFDLIMEEEAISHIKYLIKYGQKTPNALKSWEEDLEFVQNFEETLQLPAWSHLHVKKDKWRNEKDLLQKQFETEFFAK